MTCRFCATEIADKALICYRCGRPTTDARVAPPPVRRGLSAALVVSVLALLAGLAVALPSVAEGAWRTAGWTTLALVGSGVALAWLRGRRRP